MRHRAVQLLVLVPLTIALAGALAAGQRRLFLRLAERPLPAGGAFRTLDPSSLPEEARTFTRITSPDGRKWVEIYPRRPRVFTSLEEPPGIWQRQGNRNEFHPTGVSVLAPEVLLVLWKHNRIIGVERRWDRDNTAAGPYLILRFDEPGRGTAFDYRPPSSHAVSLRRGPARIRVAADGDHLDVIASDGAYSRLDADLRVVNSQRERALAAGVAWAVWCGVVAGWLILRRRWPTAIDVAVGIGALACSVWIAMAVTPWLR